MKSLLFLTFVSVISFMSQAADLQLGSDLQARLQTRVETAQATLNRTETRIASQRQAMADELNKLTQEVSALREKAAVAQRLSDEKTLSLSKLEKRLDSWRTQHVYQQNLLQRFLQQQGAYRKDAPLAGPSTEQNRLSSVIAVAETLQRQLKPQWQSAEVVMASGDILKLPTLTVGPVTWYWQADVEQAGLASVHDKAQGLLHSDITLASGASADIAALHAQSMQSADEQNRLQGIITFDPTLSRALAKAQSSEGLVEHVMKGGLWAIPIMLFALFALVIALIKSLQLLRLPKLVRFTPTVLANLVTQPDDQFSEQLNAKVGGMQKSLLDIARTCQVTQGSTRQRDDQLFMQLQDNKLWLERWIGGIAVTAAISPLLGLLGTVSGMIETFKMMTLFGSGDPAVVSGGIAQALVTTELGLVVAIPALILNAILSRRAKAYYSELESFAILLSKIEDENRADHLNQAALDSSPQAEQGANPPVPRLPKSGVQKPEGQKPTSAASAQSKNPQEETA